MAEEQPPTEEFDTLGEGATEEEEEVTPEKIHPGQEPEPDEGGDDNGDEEPEADTGS